MIRCFIMFSFGKKKQDNSQNQNIELRQDDSRAESIKSFIEILKKQHGEGLISEKTFKETLEKNEEELARLGGKAAKQKTDTSSVTDIQQSSDNAAGEETKGANKKTRKVSTKIRPKKESAESNPEKTVGEILKEEGVIHDAQNSANFGGAQNPSDFGGAANFVRVPEEKASKIKIEREVDLNRVVMDIEKLAAEVEALRDIKFQSDERIKEIAESIGEMRSLIFQRDGAIKELQIKFEKLDDAVSDIKPEKIAGEMKKREREMMEESAKVEKVERMAADMSLQIKNMQKILENIKSMENLANISREIEEKLLKMEELKTGTERDAEKSEKMYLEMERRTRELAQMREAVARLDELAKELLKSMDEDKIKIAGLASREDVQKALDSAMKLPIQNQEDKIGEKQNVESLLKSIEMQYRKGIISKESYEEVSGKNKALAQVLDKDIKDSEIKKPPQTILEWMAQTENGLKGLELKLSLLSGAIKNHGQQEPPQLLQSRQLPKAETEPEIYGSRQTISYESEIADTKNLLSELENQYREGLISEDAFGEARGKNLARLRDLEIQTPEKHVPKKTADKNNDISEKIDRLLAELGK